MIKDLRLHGSIGQVDYFAFVAGMNIHSTYFHEEGPSRIRFFSPGNELTISDHGISYRGTGGSFCEYGFGVEESVTDMKKPDILNRLIMFGAFPDNNERVVFTNNIQGEETFYRIFLQGHAVKNYYFIVSSEFKGEFKDRQKQILKSTGKFLKRTDLSDGDRDTELLDSLYSALSEERSTLYIFKLINRGNREYYDAFRSFYLKNRKLGIEEELFLEEIASRNNIDSYQRERMKIEIMYRQPENRAIVDEYKDILINGLKKEILHSSEQAKLNRLRTLGIRNNISVILFNTLDRLLLKGKNVQADEEPGYVNEARSILENLFFSDSSLKRHIIKEDIVRLIKANNKACSLNEKGMEKVLLDIGKACDDLSRETDDFSVLEEFSSLVTYFDRYDNVRAMLGNLAFMKNPEFREDAVRSLLGNKKAFDELDDSLFHSVFIKELYRNKYITGYGKRKIELVVKGLDNIKHGEAAFKDVVKDLKLLADEENLYSRIYSALKENLRSFVPGLEVRGGRDRVRAEIEKNLSEDGPPAEIPAELFEKVFVDLRKESIYLNQILPRIIQNKDTALREDFLRNSGLDRFLIESLEQAYLAQRGLDRMLLEKLTGDNPLQELEAASGFEPLHKGFADLPLSHLGTPPFE